VHVLTEALRASQDPEQSASIRRALGNAQHLRFTLIGGDPAELDTAITHLSDTAATTAEMTPHSATQVLAPAMARHSRYKLDPEGNGADLAEALRLLRLAVALLPPGDPLRPVALDDFGVVLKSCYEREGDPEKVNEAVRAQREAVALTPQGHEMLGVRLLDLGLTLIQRYSLTEDIEDLQQAQECWRRTATLPGLSRTHYAWVLEAAGLSLMAGFQRSSDPATQVAEAVRLLREALVLTPDLDPLRRSFLASTLMTNWLYTRRFSDVQEARKLADAAVAALPADSPVLPNALGVAATSRMVRSSVLAAPFVRRKVVRLLRREVELTPPGHTQRAHALTALGNVLRIGGLRRRPRRTDLVNAAELFQEAALEQQCAPSARLFAARAWGEVRAECGDWHGALDGYAVAVDLLPFLAPRHLVRSDQEFLLSQVVGLGAEAAACAVRCGRPGLAVGLLEQARGVLLSHAFDADSDLTRLRETAPDLADRFEELRDALDTATDSQDRGFLEHALLGVPHGPDAGADLRQRLAAEWRELTGRIRADHPEFGLLRPVREWDERELRATAAAGPVVLFNVYHLVI
ncbi:CHAT domain-containing protein, partial [Streptomyces anulatus]